MIDPTLRRFLLDNYNASMHRNRVQRARRSIWTDEEHRLMHEALRLLPPDCSWIDVANYIGTKTRTQTHSRALSLQRRYTRADRNRQQTLATVTASEPVHDRDQAPTGASITRMMIPQDVWAAQWCSIQAPSPLVLQHDHAMGGPQFYHTPILNTTNETDETAILHDAHPEVSAVSNSHLSNASNELENETDSQGQVFQVNPAIVQEAVNVVNMAAQEVVSDEARWNELTSLLPDNIELIDFIDDSQEPVSP